MSYTKKWGLTGLAILLVSGAWAGAAAWSSHQVGNLLHQAAENGWPDSNIKVRNLNHHAGWFHSEGDVELALVDKCNSTQKITWVQVHYEMAHLLLPTSMMQFQWTLQPTGDDKASFEEIFQGTVALNGSGHMRFDQSFDTDIHLPSLSSNAVGRHMQITPTSGFIRWGSDKLNLAISTDQITVRGQRQAVNIQQLQFHVDLDSQQQGTSTSAISFAKIDGEDLNLEGLKLSSTTQRQDGRFDMQLAFTLNRASYQKRQLADLKVAYELSGLHADSVRQLIALSGASCGFQNLTRDEHQQTRVALKALLTQGFKMGLSNLSGKLEGGQLQAQFMLDLAKSDSDAVQLSQYLKAQGHLSFDSHMLNSEQEQSLLDAGFTKPSANELKASLNYAAQQLTLNDKPFNSPLVPMMLSELDKALNAYLNQDQTNTTKILDTLLPVIPEADMPSADSPSTTAER